MLQTVFSSTPAPCHSAWMPPLPYSGNLIAHLFPLVLLSHFLLLSCTFIRWTPRSRMGTILGTIRCKILAHFSPRGMTKLPGNRQPHSYKIFNRRSSTWKMRRNIDHRVIYIMKIFSENFCVDHLVHVIKFLSLCTCADVGAYFCVYKCVFVCKMYEVRLVWGCGQKSGLKAPVTLFLMRTQVRATLYSSDIKSCLLVEHWLWTLIKLSVYTYESTTDANKCNAEVIIKKRCRKLCENIFVSLFLSSCAHLISLTNVLPNPQFVPTSGTLPPWPSSSVVTLQDWMGHD